MTYLHRNRIGGSVYIRCSEAEQSKARADEAILAAIVINQPITMVAAVVFDRQLVKSVEKVWTAQEPPLIIVYRHLNLRSRKPCEHEEHAQPCLHWRLGFRLSQVNNTPKTCDALGSSMLDDISAQLGYGHQPGMKDQVRCNDSFRQWISASEVDHSAYC